MNDQEKINSIHDGLMILFKNHKPNQTGLRKIFTAAWTINELPKIWSIMDREYEKILTHLGWL